MPLFGGEVKREFIARPDSSKGEIVYKWPDQNIRKWAQVTVQADEVAVFFRDGIVQGTITPGRATLDSSEIPFLGKLVDAATGGDLFRTELYFVSTKEFPDLPFGGMVDNVLDAESGIAVGLRVFGEYSLQVVEPQSLILRLVGTQGLQSNDQITDWMREQLTKVFRTDVVSHITKEGWPILGIAAHNDEIEQATIQNVETHVQTYGIKIVRMGNFTISIKEEDETTLKNFRRDISYTKLAGGFQQYAQGEAMLGIGQGAATGGGALPAALLGVGLGMGQNIAGGGGGGAAAAPIVQVRCASCQALNPESAKFCAGCGTAMAPPAAPAAGATIACPSCATPNAPGAKFCANCGTSMTGPPPAPQPPAGGPPEGGGTPPSGS